jgi:hypothetical protein
MNFEGILTGLSAFIIIGVFHPMVIICEYHFGVKVWPVFLITGTGLCITSVFVTNTIFSTILGITGFALLWSIVELFHQKKRVEKGWFPKKPGKK